jgi:Na+-transporting methylmalonyl-CoA/oxaloacetate decarboxylase gamma subunit
LNPINQGLTISLLGLLLTFFALGVFVLIMYVLQWLFPPQLEEKGSLEEQPALIEASGAEDETIVAAAISVALSYLRDLEQSKIGETLAAGRGPWWVANRMNFHKKINLQRR